MDITLIGHLCLDVVHRSGEQNEVRSFGGISYSLLTLANLLGSDDKVIPVFGIGEAEYDEYMDLLAPYSAIDRSGIFKTRQPTNLVHLFYDESGQARTECSQNISDPLRFERIRPFLDTDGLLINMVSGFDMTLETLDKIRMEVREHDVPIHFDFHSLTLGVDDKATRFRRPLTDWRRWCFMIHSVQMSETEASGLSAERFDEQTLVNHLMPLMVRALLITRGSRGVTLIEQINKKLERHDLPGIPVEELSDPTGCGDVFGAAFFYHYLNNEHHVAAARFANELAALKATFSGLEGLNRLRNHVPATRKESA
jgi:sugar/nucleoside kinase (ribokinase family)